MSEEVIKGSYAVDKDKAYCRWIDDPSDLADNEYLSDSPIAPIPTPPADDELISLALAQRDQLLGVAAIRIAPLQDAVDLGEASNTEMTSLKLWKQYRVAVNRAPDQEGFPNSITWPTPPDE